MNGFVKNGLCGLLLLCCLPLCSFNGGGSITGFRLRNVDGKYVSLTDYKNAKGFIVVFTCNHCPFAKLYYLRLNELAAKYEPLGVPLLAINSADTVDYEEDSYGHMLEVARDKQFRFPYLSDASQNVARMLHAQKTPHAFVIWKDHGAWTTRYSGAIDDNGLHPELVKAHFVANAVDELLGGKPVSVPETKSIGCQINFR